MDSLTIKQKVNLLRARGYNPIHIFGKAYLVRHEPAYCSKWPIYVINILKNNT